MKEGASMGVRESSPGKGKSTVYTTTVYQRLDALENEVGTGGSTLTGKADKSYVDGLAGDLSQLTTTDKSNLVNAVNENVSALADKAKQSDLNTTNTNVAANASKIGDLTQLNTVDKTSVVNALKEVKSQANTNQTQIASLANGAPIAASLVSQMTDHTRNYVYTGSESGYTAGNWYYWNGTAWTSGGVYQATQIADGSVTTTKLQDKSVTLAKTDDSVTKTIMYSTHNLYIEDYQVPDGDGDIYISFDTFRCRNGIYLDALWSVVKTHINDATRFVTSYKGVADCLVIHDDEMLVYNFSISKMQIISKTSYTPNSHFMLAFNQFGKVTDGCLLKQYYSNKRNKFDGFDSRITAVETQTITTTKLANKSVTIPKLDDSITKTIMYSTYNLYLEDYHVENGDGDIYVWFDTFRLRNGLYLDGTWSVVKTHINDSTRFVTSYKGVGDCLVLHDDEMLVYDFNLSKIQIINKLTYTPNSHFMMAFNQFGKVTDGCLLRQYYSNKRNKFDGFDSRISAVESSVSNVNQQPDYIVSDMQNTNEKTLGKMNNNTLSFAYITDTHYESSTTNVTQYSKEHAANVADYSFFGNLDFIVHGGDVVDGKLPLVTTLKDLSAVGKEMNKADCDVFVTKGNHDDNSLYVSQQTTKLLSDMVSPTTWFNRFIKPIYNHVNVNPLDPTGGYFYKDFDFQKIRVVVLNLLDIPFTANADNSPKYFGIWTYGLSNNQLNWVANTALNFSSKGSDKSNWHILVIGHIPPLVELSFPGDSAVNNGTVLHNILLSFKAGNSYTSTPTTGDFAQSVQVDFTSQGAMTLVGYIHGHTHYDLTTNKDGINYVSVLNSLALKETNLATGASSYDRVIGTDTEDSWEVFTIDKQARQLYGMKYGAGNDRTVSY